MQRLQRLRAIFLDEGRAEHATGDYWRSDEDLSAYAQFLGARIGWKWDAALAECKARGMARADDRVVLDYGCGAGIAALRFVAGFGAKEVLCFDRSARAMAFAAREVERAHPGVRARPVADVRSVPFDVLLASHVINELDARGLDELEDLARRAQTVVLVEAGDRATSRRLSQLRERLLPHFAVVAPCPHALACPSLVRENDWCHFFADPHPTAFTDGDFVSLAKELGIDQRALPYAFLALSKAATGATAPQHRVVGRPELDKHTAKLTVCTGEGLAEALVRKREQPETFRLLKKDPGSVRALP